MATKDKRGFWQDKSGGYVHKDMIVMSKQLEDEEVERIIAEAINIQEKLREFKINAFNACQDFNDLLKQEYNLKRIKSKSGAVTLKNFNGTKEVQISVQKLLVFDQKLVLAKGKIDEYLDSKTEQSDPDIRTLITKVFDVKNGKVDAKQIFGLKSYPIKDERWIEAMRMIDDATEIAGSKSYIRFKQRENGCVDGAMTNIVLDIAKIDISQKI